MIGSKYPYKYRMISRKNRIFSGKSCNFDIFNTKNMDFAIIAAGEGSRLVQEGITTPKPLIKIQGAPLIERLLQIFLRNGASSISVIVNEEMTEVQHYLEKIRMPVPFHLHVRSTPSSMHSFYELSRYLHNDCFCLTTVDTIFREEEFGGYIQAFKDSDNIDGLMAVTDFVDDEKPLYVKTDRDMRILGFEDGPPKPPQEGGCKGGDESIYVSGGIYCLRRTCIDVLERAISEGMSRMRNYQRRLVAEGLYLKAYPFAKIIDVDHAEDIGKAEAFLSGITTKGHEGGAQRDTKEYE
jgi:NDP-sugar pyrophosphorylase family protein